ncbi:MAG: hypothetical protein ACREDI_09870 [Roseiarcus sp.]
MLKIIGRVLDGVGSSCSPSLMEEAGLGEERPGIARLMREVMDRSGDRGGRDEEIVLRVGQISSWLMACIVSFMSST